MHLPERKKREKERAKGKGKGKKGGGKGKGKGKGKYNRRPEGHRVAFEEPQPEGEHEGGGDQEGDGQEGEDWGDDAGEWYEGYCIPTILAKAGKMMGTAKPTAVAVKQKSRLRRRAPNQLPPQSQASELERAMVA